MAWPTSELRRDIHKKTVALVVVERKHLVGKICDDHARPAGAIVIRGIDAHAGAGHSIFAERDARRHGALFEGAVLLIHVQLVRLRIVGDRMSGQPSLLESRMAMPRLFELGS